MFKIIVFINFIQLFFSSASPLLCFCAFIVAGVPLLCWARKLLDFIKKIWICVPKMNAGLTGLEWQEGE